MLYYFDAEFRPDVQLDQDVVPIKSIETGYRYRFVAMLNKRFYVLSFIKLVNEYLKKVYDCQLSRSQTVR